MFDYFATWGLQALMTGLIMLYTFIYVRGMVAGKLRPVLSTWIFISFAVILSLVTAYREMGYAGMMANAFNVVDSIAVIGTTLYIVWYPKSIRTFSRFEKKCLAAIILITIVWLMGISNIITHASVQVLLIISYVPMWKSLWKSKANTESLWMWIFNGVASLVGFIIAIHSREIMPIVFTARALVCISVVIILVMRVRRKGDIAKRG